MPSIALAVLLENGGGGSEYAAPVAREIIDYYLLEGAGGRVPDVAMARPLGKTSAVPTPVTKRATMSRGSEGASPEKSSE